MQSFEYSEVVVWEGVWLESDGGRELIDTRGWSPNTALPLLTRLGGDGWEVCGVASSGISSYRVLLKRPSTRGADAPPAPVGVAGRVAMAPLASRDPEFRRR